MADTGLPHNLPYLQAADPPAIHTITQAMSVANVAALARVTGSLQEGVLDAGSYEVTQASGGASTSVDVASNVGAGGYVQNDSATGQALGYLAPTGAKTTVTITAADATLPRVDAVVVSLAGVVSIVAGTAVSGATLDNCRDGSHGGAAIPSSSLHLADLLVPATDTTISNSQIRDRRKWARGANFSVERTGGNYTTTSTSAVLIDGTNLNPRFECSGRPIRATISGIGSATAGDVAAQLFVDGALIGAQSDVFLLSDDSNTFYASYTWTPSAGSHKIGWAWRITSAGTATLFAGTGLPLVMTVEEIVRQNAANNTTTSG